MPTSGGSGPPGRLRWAPCLRQLLAPNGHWYNESGRAGRRQRDSGLNPSCMPFLPRGAVVILTSAARSGGEVRITEAERPRRIRPGRGDARPGSRRRAPHGRVRRQLADMWLLCFSCYPQLLAGGRLHRPEAVVTEPQFFDLTGLLASGRRISRGRPSRSDRQQGRG